MSVSGEVKMVVADAMQTDIKPNTPGTSLAVQPSPDELNPRIPGLAAGPEGYARYDGDGYPIVDGGMGYLGYPGMPGGYAGPDEMGVNQYGHEEYDRPRTQAA
jgi:hypothetical protein